MMNGKLAVKFLVLKPPAIPLNAFTLSVGLGTVDILFGSSFFQIYSYSHQKRYYFCPFRMNSGIKF